MQDPTETRAPKVADLGRAFRQLREQQEPQLRRSLDRFAAQFAEWQRRQQPHAETAVTRMVARLAEAFRALARERHG